MRNSRGHRRRMAQDAESAQRGCTRESAAGRIVKMGIIKLSQSVALHFIVSVDEDGVAKVAGREREKERKGKTEKLQFRIVPRTRDFYLLIALSRAECIA